MSVAGVRICSIDWDSFPFTDLTFHVADFFSISSFQCDYGLLRRLTLVWVIFRHSRISQGPWIHRSTDLSFHESTNHDPMSPLIYPRIHKHLHLAHHAQGKGKPCGVLRLLRIHESIYGFASLQSTNPQIYKSINPRIHKTWVNHLIWVCLPLHTVCCRPHFAHYTRGQDWRCDALPVLSVLWYG
jgi:hypothetical protein